MVCKGQHSAHVDLLVSVLNHGHEHRKPRHTSFSRIGSALLAAVVCLSVCLSVIVPFCDGSLRSWPSALFLSGETVRVCVICLAVGGGVQTLVRTAGLVSPPPHHRAQQRPRPVCRRRVRARGSAVQQHQGKTGEQILSGRHGQCRKV